jgi:endonuclease YncB( thermonuclease family)
MKVFVVLLALSSVLCAAEFPARVVSITDGDTLVVLSDKQQVRIRLHGIDSPERAQPYGTRARQFTGELAHQRDVTVVVRDYDRYGRVVAEIILPDGRNLNHEIVRAGFAWWYRQYARGDETLEQLEREARDARRGLWADSAPVPPWRWRKEHHAKRRPERSERRSKRRSASAELAAGMSLSLQAMTAARHQWPVPPSVPEVRPVRAAPEPSTPVDLELLRKALDDYVSTSDPDPPLVW